MITYGAIIDLELYEQVDALTPFKTSILTGILAGILGGTTMVFLWEKWIRSKPYGWTIRNICISYILIFTVIAYFSNAFYQSQMLDVALFDSHILFIAAQRLTYATTLIPFTTWLIVVVLTVITLQVNDKYGPGVFIKFLMGRYFNPKREQRIFMFLDLRASTSIAERLGERDYFFFLKDTFRYATPAILKSKGEIYQYVGDEIVISWELDNGIKNLNCIQCYFNIREDLKDQKVYFQERYNEYPEFKAGIHYGHVMAGELGVVKREIAFSGDVLNTTARIQSKCNELGTDFLASDDVVQLLKPTGVYQPTRIGEIELRGKKDPITLFTV